ncbi:18093_t:CDS:2, partial [Funneliformis geosporum]
LWVYPSIFANLIAKGCLFLVLPYLPEKYLNPIDRRFTRRLQFANTRLYWSPPTPYPNPNTGLPTQQYWFGTARSLLALTNLPSVWYTKVEGKLAHLILSDGYWDNHYQVVFLCTDFFAERDILLLCEALHTRFDLLAKPNKRITSTGKKCWRIRFSSEESNLVKLRSIVDPFILPELAYK